MSIEDQKASTTPSERGHEVPAAQARQAVVGHGIRYVLGIGLALVVIAFAVIYFVNFR
jgi:hypothetical protein